MILEGIVTTLGPSGQPNISPMGPRLPIPLPPSGILQRFTLRPFRTARTYANLLAHPEGVLHVTDDVLLLARSAIGTVSPSPALRPATVVRGWVLVDACRSYEFRITSRDDSAQRSVLEAEVVHTQRGSREFLGFNRARHAVLEAAILATRVALLPHAEIESEFRRLAVLVEKTGGPAEHEAFALLRRHVESARSASEG
jgi:hypothetical protein